MADKEERSEKRVDEDWKERARKEREALDREAAKSAGKGGGGAAKGEAGPSGGQESAKATGAGGQLPPATFLGLVAGIAAQASVYFGFVENPISGEKETDLEAAKHVIDTLGMLKEKTEGNLDEAESGYLEDLLYGLRMEYVKRTT